MVEKKEIHLGTILVVLGFVGALASAQSPVGLTIGCLLIAAGLLAMKYKPEVVMSYG